MTGTQRAKQRKATPEYKAWRIQKRREMLDAHAKGIDVSTLATCPDSYSIALKIKYN